MRGRRRELLVGLSVWVGSCSDPTMRGRRRILPKLSMMDHFTFRPDHEGTATFEDTCSSKQQSACSDPTMRGRRPLTILMASSMSSSSDPTMRGRRRTPPRRRRNRRLSSDPTMRGRRLAVSSLTSKTTSKFRPDHEGTATWFTSTTGSTTRFRPDHEGTATTLDLYLRDGVERVPTRP